MDSAEPVCVRNDGPWRHREQSEAIQGSLFHQALACRSMNVSIYMP